MLCQMSDARRINCVEGAVGRIKGIRLCREGVRPIISLSGDNWDENGYWMVYGNVATFLFCKC